MGLRRFKSDSMSRGCADKREFFRSGNHSYRRNRRNPNRIDELREWIQDHSPSKAIIERYLPGNRHVAQDGDSFLERRMGAEQLDQVAADQWHLGIGRWLAAPGSTWQRRAARQA